MRVTLNPDKKYANDVLKQVKSNNGYCPCKLEKTPETKCMCLEFRAQEEGMCRCGLYVKHKD